MNPLWQLLAITLTVSAKTWTTPMTGAKYGWVVRYAYQQNTVEANADARGYDLTPYYDRCGFATMSPANLGHIGWFKLEDGTWYGPCLAVDVSALHDFYANVFVRKEVAEVGPNIASALKFEHGRRGVVYMGLCPPGAFYIVDDYSPPLTFGPDVATNPYPTYQYPQQELPVSCGSPTYIADAFVRHNRLRY